jgi:signal transduction histidine kinase
MVDKPRNAEDQAHLLIFNRHVMIGGQAAYFFVVGIIYFFYMSVVPNYTMTAWLAFAAIIFSYIVIFDIALFLRKPGPEELLRVWRAIDKKHTIFFDLILVGVILFLLPYGKEDHRLVTAAICVGYVPLQMISDPENVFGNRFSILAVLGAFVFFLLEQGQPHFYILAACMVIYGATLFFASDAFRNVVVDAVKAKRNAELANLNLAQALRDVSAERDARTRFIASVSHDLGQPLSAARMFGEQLTDHQSNGAGNTLLAGLNRAIVSAQTMLGNLLHHMQLEADAVNPHLVQVEIQTLLGNLAEQHKLAAEQAGLTIRVAGRPATIKTDGVLLVRAVGNLLQNSITHSGASAVLLGYRSRKSLQEIWVIDNGVGVKRGEEEVIFESYGQGSNSRSAIKGGFGLGLSSVNRLARLLGGDARLDTRWKNGAAFCITLPTIGATQ